MFGRLVTAVSKALSKAPSPAEVKKDGKQKPAQQNNDSKHPNPSSSPSAGSTEPKKEAKKEDAKSTAVTQYTGPALGEAWPSNVHLDTGVRQLIISYHGGHFDANPKRYTEQHCLQFSLFGNNQIALESQRAYEIGTLCLASQRTAAFALAQRYPRSLQCITETAAPNGVVAEGLPLGLAAAGGDPFLVQMLKTLLPKSEADAQLAARFPRGWIDEQKEINKGMLDELTWFRDRLAEKRLPQGSLADALIARWDLIIQFRGRLRSKLQGPAGTARKTGLIFDPQVCVDARDFILASEKDLGWTSLESWLLWVVGFQSFLGNGSAILVQILNEGADNYSEEKAPAEALVLKNGSPAFPNDPATGLGATFVVDLFDGDVYGRGCGGPDVLLGAGRGIAAGARRRRAWAPVFWKTYVEQQHQYCRAYAASGPAVNNDAGAVEFRRNP